jgi:hypothetical protein
MNLFSQANWLCSFETQLIQQRDILVTVRWNFNVLIKFPARVQRCNLSNEHIVLMKYKMFRQGLDDQNKRLTIIPGLIGPASKYRWLLNFSSKWHHISNFSRRVFFLWESIVDVRCGGPAVSFQGKNGSFVYLRRAVMGSLVRSQWVPSLPPRVEVLAPKFFHCNCSRNLLPYSLLIEVRNRYLKRS